MAVKFNALTASLDEYGPILTGTGTVAAAGDGTVNLPGIAFASDLDTGIYRPGNNQLAISTNGTGRLFIDANGNVGIGTATPVNSASYSSLTLQGTTGGQIALRAGSTLKSYFYNDATKTTIGAVDDFVIATTGSITERLRITSTGALNFLGAGTAGSTQAVSFNGSAPVNSLVINSSGRVGLGTSSPSTLLSLYAGANSEYFRGGGNGVTTRDLVISASTGTNAGDTHTINASGASGQLILSTASTPRMLIDSSGRVGIGTTSPGYKVDIAASSGTNRLRLINSGTSAADQSSLQFDAGASDYVIYAKGDENKLFVYDATAAANRIVVDSSGRVGIGTSSPSGNLHVSGSSSSLYDSTNMLSTNSFFRASNTDTTAGIATGITFEATGDGAQAAQAAIRCVHTGSGAAALALGTKRGAVQPVAEALRIDSSGRVGIGTQTPDRSLHVQSAGSSIVSEFEATALGFASIDLSNTAGYARFTSIGNSLAFAPGGTEAARIDSSGTFRVKGAGTAGTTDAVQLNGSAPANSLLLDASGRLLAGTSTTLSTDAILQIRSTSPANVIEASRRANDSSPARFNFSKTRGSSTDIVLNNDIIGEFVFRASDGVVDTAAAARIAVEVDGTPGANDMPGRLVFSTTADGAASPTERMRITSDAYVRLASGTGGIQFNGDTAAANALDDYEEGTFTPSVRIDSTSGTTITLNNDFRTLRYVKVGRAVFIQGRLTSNDTPASGTLISVTLPFAPIGTAGGQNYTEVLTTRTGVTADLTRGRIENYTDLRISVNPNTFTTNNFYHLNFWYYTDS